MKNTELKEDRDFVHAVMDKRMDERKDFITYLCKNANSKDPTTSRFFRQVVNDMNSKNLITDKEHRVIFNPPKTINKSEINKALSSINREMDEAAEEFALAEEVVFLEVVEALNQFVKILHGWCTE